MNELAVREPRPSTDPTGGRLVAWADGLGAAHKIGTALCQTAFVPAHFRNKPEEAAAAILYGDEIGLSPTQSLQNIYVISGKPALYARTMVALTLAAGHEVWTVKKTDGEVSVSGRRRGSEHTITETWSTSRANKAGYTKNAKYQTDPQSMLYARAASDVCRQIAPDALAGLVFSVEEMEMSGEDPKPARRTARRQSAPASDPTPPAIESTVEPEPTEDEPPLDDDGPTEPMLTKMHTLFSKVGWSDRDDRLRAASTIAGRELDSSTDLTKAEASRLIDALETCDDADDLTDLLAAYEAKTP